MDGWLFLLRIGRLANRIDLPLLLFAHHRSRPCLGAGMALPLPLVGVPTRAALAVAGRRSLQ